MITVLSGQDSSQGYEAYAVYVPSTFGNGSSYLARRSYRRELAMVVVSRKEDKDVSSSADPGGRASDHGCRVPIAVGERPGGGPGWLRPDQRGAHRAAPPRPGEAPGARRRGPHHQAGHRTVGEQSLDRLAGNPGSAGACTA